ncbi:hypothetical protein GWI33_008595 [Rhynchophorus ferrugineus]|uniref:RING-type E3 ubiquitin transferase n=1 Tax=Rhynchophorus ferrugineus TaxID=354439 RepID=A0A834IGG1_RHYFE|nr:hypothetical protein GWI33_008595 [Rhynchophorus ferrugineus]
MDVKGVSVPLGVLSELICYRCKRYLSVFPIYTHAVRGSICGRCTAESAREDGFLPNIIYETSASYQRFPCCNDKRGCLEYLIPYEMNSHEQKCSYKVIKCPTRVNSNCLWEGASSDILEHFNTEHPINILSKDVFEVDIINAHTDYFLYVYNEEIFLLQKSSDNNKFSLKLEPLIKVDDNNKMTYEIKLSTANKEKEICDTKYLDDTYSINIMEIKNKLNNPTIIIGHLNILKNVTTHSNTNTKSRSNESQMNMLECPVCLEYLVPPILQCRTGHSICSSCKSELNQCPTCKSEFIDTRNFLVENLVASMNYSCKYDECPYQGKPTSIKAHQESCIFGPFKCPLKEYQSCNEIFAFKDLYRHVMDRHYEYLLEIDTLCCLYEYNEKIFKFSVHLIGNPEDNLTYKYDIDFNNAKTNNRLYIKQNCDTTNSQPFQYDGAIVLTYRQLSDFVNHEICFRTRVSIEHSK